jgi:hypothetical protein
MARIGWTITFEGRAWCESDLSVADAGRVIALAGGTWSQIHPLASPDHFAVILASFLVYSGEDFDAALLRAASVPMVAALEMVKAGEPPASLETTPIAVPDDDSPDEEPPEASLVPAEPKPAAPPGGRAKRRKVEVA